MAIHVHVCLLMSHVSLLYVCVSRDQHGFTPMHHAAMHGHSSVIDIFIGRGARVDIVNMGGDTLLHIAAAYGKYDIAQKVLCSTINSNTLCLMYIYSREMFISTVMYIE